MALKRFSKILRTLVLLALLLSGAKHVFATSYFVEAEAFDVKGDGWKPFANGQDPPVGAASGLKTLCGGAGAGDSVATTQIEIPVGGEFRLWVRYMESAYRGPFVVKVKQNGVDVATQIFDRERRPNIPDWSFAWTPIDHIKLAAGFATVEFEKFEGKNASYSRHIDCILLTNDMQLIPTHEQYGPQTWLRVTLGDVYANPVYVEIFADHYRAPWDAHYSISKAGLENMLQPSKPDSLFHGGESTGWINITPMVYEDTGANLTISVRETYIKGTPRLKAKFEFATAASDSAIVKTLERDVTFGIPGATRPGGIALIVPPNLTTKQNIDRLVMEIDIANATGKIADNFKWPTIGKPPERYPFTVAEALHGSFPYDTKVMERELKTLDYFGFNNAIHKVVGSNTWITKNNCYSQPDIEGMKAAAKELAEQVYKTGAKPENIAWIMQMDEPQGQPLEHIAQCAACTAAFREWLQQQKVPLANLGATSWDTVKPVVDGKSNPELYYYSQKFRVHALGKFLAIQHDIAAAAYGVNAPTSPNFSDGATYAGNLYMMGIDYFDLLDSTSQSGDVQNAIWGENWGNGAAGSQCTTYNVELMRSAAMKSKQTIGQYLITYYGRLPWDIKLNAVSQAARDVKAFESFFYGPSWAGHEGGMPWQSSAWHSRPFNWYANAELTREFGGSEDLLYTAKKAPSSVGIIYSSSSDIWTLGVTNSYGFDRLFIWTALTHAQIPVDFISEKTLALDNLKNYRVLYLSGPNLSHAAADKLVKWVKDGGTLVITAGAAARDEYNRPQTTLDEILPGTRGEVVNFEGFTGASGYLGMLHPKESVSTADHNASLDVLCVKQSLTPKAGSEVLASYADANPAYVSWKIGKGRVYQSGFLPGLSYIFPAITARKKLETEVGKIDPTDIPDATKVVAPEALLRRTQAPWDYPAAVRDLIAAPVRASDAHLPIKCDTPLVDAVLMESNKGAVIPLSNYTMQPLSKITLTATTPKKVKKIESIHHGDIPFTRKGPNEVKFSLPLQETDFVLLRY